jgi:hypothetical protein
MLEIRQEILTSLRNLAGSGIAPSMMLREVLLRYNLEEPRSAVLAYYCALAFDLATYQLSSIYYWNVFGTGKLSDAEVDHFLGRHLNNAGWPCKTSEAVVHE